MELTTKQVTEISKNIVKTFSHYQLHDSGNFKGKIIKSLIRVGQKTFKSEDWQNQYPVAIAHFIIRLIDVFLTEKSADIKLSYPISDIILDVKDNLKYGSTDTLVTIYLGYKGIKLD